MEQHLAHFVHFPTFALGSEMEMDSVSSLESGAKSVQAFLGKGGSM